jgi:hypothetical protein
MIVTGWLRFEDIQDVPLERKFPTLQAEYLRFYARLLNCQTVKTAVRCRKPPIREFPQNSDHWQALLPCGMGLGLWPARCVRLKPAQGGKDSRVPGRDVNNSDHD